MFVNDALGELLIATFTVIESLSVFPYWSDQLIVDVKVSPDTNDPLIGTAIVKPPELSTTILWLEEEIELKEGELYAGDQLTSTSAWVPDLPLLLVTILDPLSADSIM